MSYEENFDEICWSLEELKKCEKLLRDMAEQHTENYLNNFKIILK